MNRPIDRLLELLVRSASQLEGWDAISRRVDRTGFEYESGRLKTASVTEESGTGLRVLRHGRAGLAGSTAPDPAPLLEKAFASAELGEQVTLAFPQSLEPAVDFMDNLAVTIHEREAADASTERLTEIGRTMVERLTRDGCQVNVSIERIVGETRFVNSAGLAGSYAETAVVVGADIRRIAGDDVLMVYDQYSAVGLPGDDDLAALADSILTRLDHALKVVAPPAGALPVVFTPFGLAAILLPLEQALSGKAVLQGVSPLAGRTGEQVFDPSFSLIDDPLLPGRTGSRPIDDEGVTSRRLPLIEQGVVQAFIYDLETAGRAGTTSTGHGRRGIFGKPHAAYSNLLLGPYAPRTTHHILGGGLLDGIRDGLIVDDLIGVGQGNVIGGAFSHPVALAYRIQDGKITGRVKDAAVAGNVYELLKRAVAWGTDGRWVGSRWSASLRLEGVSVAR